jgi:hypothetical protein
MMFKHRAGVLLFLPMLFFGLGSLTAGVATSIATFIAPEPATLLDAVAGGNDEAMVRMISEGEDPGLPAVLKRPVHLLGAWGDSIAPPACRWRRRHQ